MAVTSLFTGMAGDIPFNGTEKAFVPRSPTELCSESLQTLQILLEQMKNKNLSKVFFKPHIDICCYTVTQTCLILCDPMDCSMPGFPVYHQLLELVQMPVH